MGSRFRTSFTHKEGVDSALILQGRIVNVHLKNFTVDVSCQFDRRRYFDVQVASSYVHYAGGEGTYVVPEVGAVCMVCVPSDSSPPFVMGFLMPHELADDASAGAPAGTRSRGGPTPYATDATFAGGRANPKPGDIVLRGRDQNFVVLHRGGVLQVGATELAQRLYIPLKNLVIDIAENYAMHAAGGSILWGIQDGGSLETLPSEYVHTFRVFAGSKHADIRLSVGKVHTPVAEPDGGIALAAGGVGGAEPIALELTVSPQGFVAETGEVASSGTGKASTLKFVFDAGGNTLFRCEGSLGVHVRKKVSVTCSDDVALTSDKAVSLVAKNGIDVQGGAYAHLKGDVVRLGPGTTAVARLGDLVTVPVTAVPVTLLFATLPIPGTPAPALLTTGPAGVPMPLVGSIASGNSRVLA